ncbi:MAG TPA: hypothetical protein VH349_00670 [Ktedonobacterales bacterium]|jgi:hypothetical protein
MSQDQANKTLPPVTGNDRIAVITGIILGTLIYAGTIVWIIASFTSLAKVAGLPLLIAFALMVPIFLWIMIRPLRPHASEPPWFAVVGAGGGTLALVLVIVQDIARRSSASPLPAAFETSVSALEWLGIALVAIGDLMLIAALGGFLLARLRASA